MKRDKLRDKTRGQRPDRKEEGRVGSTMSVYMCAYVGVLLTKKGVRNVKIPSNLN